MLLCLAHCSCCSLCLYLCYTCVNRGYVGGSSGGGQDVCICNMIGLGLLALTQNWEMTHFMYVYVMLHKSPTLESVMTHPKVISINKFKLINSNSLEIIKKNKQTSSCQLQKKL